MVLLSTINYQLSTARAQGTAFAYQGQLFDNGGPANGSYALRFTLYNSSSNSVGAVLAGPLTNAPVAVSNGLFTVLLDFGPGQFTGAPRWLQVDAATNSANPLHLPLTPRQLLAPAPYAIFANTASNLSGTMPTAQLSGTVLNNQLASNSVTVNPGTGLSGGGVVTLGSTLVLSNAGVLTVTGNADITATPTNGNVVLGDTAASANTPSTLVKRDGSGSFVAGTVTLAGNLNLPATTATAGIIYSGAATLMHAYGSQSFFAGPGAGNLTQTGAGANTGVGDQALSSITSGYNNTANGFKALFANSSGVNNTADGYFALASNTNGIYNTANGYDALLDNTSGSANTASGAGALLANSTGSNNVADGFESLLATTSGSGNIALGYSAGINLTGNASSNIDIGHPGVLGDNNTIRIGNGQTQTFLTGVINGNGSGLTGVNAAAVSGLTTSNFWQNGGNSGTLPGPNFLGTTDNQPLELHVNSQRGLRLDYIHTTTGSSPNTVNNYSLNVNGGYWGNTISNGVMGATIAGGGYQTSIGQDFPDFHPNMVGDNFGTIGGGTGNWIQTGGYNSVIGGGSENIVSGSYATIGGGQLNSNTFYAATVGGGAGNAAGGLGATVGGGYHNTANGGYATVGGGQNNTASSGSATVGGGQGNQSTLAYATVGGGAGNIASGENSTVGGGSGNIASGNGATVAGGYNNIAMGLNSFAGGSGAVAGDGSFVWADSYANPGEYYTGGFANYTKNQYGVLTNYDGTPYQPSQGTDGVSFRTAGAFFVWLPTEAPVQFRAGVGTNYESIYWQSGTGGWVDTSDRNKKDHITPVDTQAVLEKLARLPVSEWNYIGHPQHHIGPMAQDFHAMFPLANNAKDSDTTINEMDERGVALAAIQGLNEKVESGKQTAEARMEKLEAENTELQNEVSELKQLVKQMAGQPGNQNQQR